MEKLLSKIPDWLIISFLIGLLGWTLFKIRQLFKFISHSLFGEDGGDYKELTGAAGFFGFVAMLVKHLLDSSYTPDVSLLTACVGIVLTLAGINKAGSLLNKHIDNIKGSKEEKNKIITKKENDNEEGMDI